MGASVGASASLTMVELQTANDLNNMILSKYKGTEPIETTIPQACERGTSGGRVRHR